MRFKLIFFNKLESKPVQRQTEKMIDSARHFRVVEENKTMMRFLEELESEMGYKKRIASIIPTTHVW